MNSPTAIRNSNFPFNLLLFITAIPFVLVWLPLIRCTMDGATYSWGQTYFGYTLSSSGIEADLLFLVVQLAFYIALFVSFYRAQNRKLFYLLLGLWFVNVYGNFFHLLITEGDVEFHGDTLDVHTSLAQVIIPIALISLAAILFVIRKDLRMENQDIPWGRGNKTWLLVLLGLLPLQLVLFASGKAHGTTDEIGVILTILQSFLIPFIFLPRAERS